MTRNVRPFYPRTTEENRQRQENYGFPDTPQGRRDYQAWESLLWHYQLQNETADRIVPGAPKPTPQERHEYFQERKYMSHNTFQMRQRQRKDSRLLQHYRHTIPRANTGSARYYNDEENDYFQKHFYNKPHTDTHQQRTQNWNDKMNQKEQYIKTNMNDKGAYARTAYQNEQDIMTNEWNIKPKRYRHKSINANQK